MKYLLNKNVLKIVLYLIFCLLYFYGSVEHLRKVNLGGTDQNAYISYAKNMSNTGYQYIGNRNQMPLYSFIQSLFYNPEMNDEDFFIQGKYINIIMSFVLLVLIFRIFRRKFNFFYTTIALLITAFTVFIFKAATFKPALLFYFFNFAGFLLLWKMFKYPTSKLGGFAGVVLGLAYLTKASVLPALVIFIVIYIFKIINMMRDESNDQREFFKYIFSGLLLIGFFLVTIFPYINNSKKIYGHYFYNINSAVFVWADSLNYSIDTGVYDDIRDMPPVLKPGPLNYFRNHRMEQIKYRMFNLPYKLFLSLFKSYGYMKYILIYASVLLILLIVEFKWSIKFIKKDFFIFLFLVFYFVSYSFLYGWYAAVGSGNRFMLTLFLPFIYVAYAVMHILGKRKVFFKPNLSYLDIVNIIVAVVLSIDIYIIITERIFLVYGAS